MESIEKKMLDQFVEGKKEVVVILMNGFQMRGVITGHDETALSFLAFGKEAEQLIYKRVLSTVRIWET